jgi:hypothetical protein
MSERNSSKSTSRSGRVTRASQHALAGAEELRLRLAREAARIMAEEGKRDYAAVKRKAAERLALPDAKHLPSNEEIEHELRRYLELFQGKALSGRVAQLRRITLEAMRFLHPYDPRLVGSVLTGTVTEGSIVELHISAETPEDVGLWLDEHEIPFEHTERRLRFGGDRYDNIPALRFTADAVTIELCVFNHRSIRETPLSPVDGKPMKRANLREVETLMTLG